MPRNGQPQQPQKPEVHPLAARILKDGPMPLPDFMAEAVREYYSGKEPFGVKGDFITAPEISQVFGELIGAWAADLWMQAGKPSPFNLIELGPGRGTLSADMLRVMRRLPGLLDALKLHLVEISPALKARQAETLKDYRPAWHGNIAALPQGFSIIIANEFFDALPIRQFERVGGKWHERHVGYDMHGKELFFTLKPHDGEGLPASAPDGGIIERCPAAIDVVGHIAARLKQHGGAALAIDYGYLMPALRDTLQGYRKHKFTHVLRNPGAQDITADVDFSALGSAASASGLTVQGPVTQGVFLEKLGISARAQKLGEKANMKQREDLALAIRRLTAASEMGQRFKVIGFSYPPLKPAGFT
jgi:NADH dehydrogenase [ubiquinone] 1 alpha subcomplex assembly factor 7